MNNRSPEADKKIYPTFLSYEIYDSERFKGATVVAGIVSGLIVLASMKSEKTSTELAACFALAILCSASILHTCLRAEDKAVKDARAGYRVYNAFRNTYSEEKNKDAPDLDHKAKLKM
jgi:hypothetical protein